MYHKESTDEEIPLSKSRVLALQELQRTVRGHPEGLAHLTILLETARSEMTKEGHISETIATKIYDAFYLWDYVFALRVMSARPPAEKGSSSEEDQEADEERPFVIAFIDDQLKKICRLEELAIESDKLELESEARSLSLPPADVADKIMRYEAHLDRQLQRTMDQHERLQRQRKGDKVLPPLNISLSRRG